LADGVLEEFDLAKADGHVLIPVPATGGAAAEIWSRMEAQLSDFFGSADVSKEFEILKDPAREENEWVEAIFSIVAKARRS
jgi:hypothetical protein